MSGRGRLPLDGNGGRAPQIAGSAGSGNAALGLAAVVIPFYAKSCSTSLEQEIAVAGRRSRGRQPAPEIDRLSGSAD